MSYNKQQPDDRYTPRYYDVDWRSLKAGALLAALIVVVAFMI